MRITGIFCLFDCTNVKLSILIEMEIEVYKPESPLLQEYIECFYVLTRSGTDAPVTYLTFPGLQQAVSLYAETTTEVTDDRVVICHEPNSLLESRIVGDFQQAVCVHYEGRIHEITTLFKPLAINSFLTSPLKEYATSHFPKFEPYPDFMTAMQDIYNTVCIPEKLQALESYWQDKYNGFQHPFLPTILEHLYLDNFDEQNITEICRIYGISRQTMYQHFTRYLCKTPSLFRKIVRFRKTMKNYRLEIRHPEFSQLSALANYFDQSHMIRDFKTLTGHTPKNFFHRISRMGNGEVNFMFMD